MFDVRHISGRRSTAQATRGHSSAVELRREQIAARGTVVLHKLVITVADACSRCRRSFFCATFSHTGVAHPDVISLLPSLAEHAEHTLQTLASIAEAGLFESSEAAWKRLTADEGAETSPANQSIDSVRVFILTCDRPEALRRLLAGLAENQLPPEIESVWVIDDSRDEANVSANASVIADVSGVLSKPASCRSENEGQTDRAHQRRAG